MKRRKICIVTGTRAEFGLFLPLLHEIRRERRFQLQIIATGMHLSPEFGSTFQEIRKEGFRINAKVEMLLSSDTETGITKSIGMGIIGFADALEKLRPDIILLLGDRFEILSAAVASVIRRIPIAHIHGGEITIGAFDDFLRHAITKMSLYHFTSMEIYRKRVIQMGESPERVFTVGALGIDNIKKRKLLSRKELQKRLDIDLGKRSILVTFHPATLEDKSSESQFRQLLRALDHFKDLQIIFTMPNADTGGRIIMKLIRDYVKKNPSRARCYVSMGQLNYLSCLQYAQAVVGNSSSGIIEVPSFKIPTVNIGNRQIGRQRPLSVIDCQPRTKEIIWALKKAFSGSFLKTCQRVKNPYGDGHTAERIRKILVKVDLDPEMMKKGFFDLKFNLRKQGK